MMRDNLPSLLALSIAILLIPSSLKAGGKDEKKPVEIRRICIRPASVLRPYSLEDTSTNLVSLGKELTPEERAGLERNFLIVHGVKNKTRTSNKQK